MRRLLAAAGLALILSGCGVKAPPRPPAEPVAPRPEGTRARVREGCVELAWKAPLAAEGANAVTASGATVAAGAETAGRAAALAGLPLPVQQYEVLRAREAEPGREPVFTPAGGVAGLSFRDCTAEPGVRYLYRVRAVAVNGVRSQTGGTVTAGVGPVPAAPEKLTATSGDGFVGLAWKRPPDLPADARFNVYRSEEAGEFPWRPVNPEPLTESRYSDGPLVNGEKYFYEVRAVLPQPKSPMAEGPAASVQATPVDRAPPDAPQGLIVSWTGKRVELRWFKNPEPDLAGYHVYRRSGSGRYVRLNDKLLTDNTFSDGAVHAGRSYQYAVTAVDRAQPPNESPASDPQSIYAAP